MSKKYILSVDQSTTGTKALIVDHNGEVIARSYLEHKQYYPNPGWAEQDPVEIYNNVKLVINDVLCLADLSTSSIEALAITNQRETVVVWDKKTGMPIYPAIVWQCRRTAEYCRDLKAQNLGHNLEKTIKFKTGLLIDPYFSASKVTWILEHVSDAKKLAYEGCLAMGTIDSWLIWRMTNGTVHATDYTNASRTQLFNIHTLQWDKELLGIYGIPEDMLPIVKASDAHFGETDLNGLLPGKLPICGVIGDSQAALFGQCCFEPGMAKVTYGTGSSLLMHIGDSPKESRAGLVTSIAWAIGNKVDYVFEGIIHSTGDTLKWVKDQLGLFEKYDDLETIAGSLQDNDGVYLVPAFVGLGAPYWDPYARAAITGMTRSTNKAHIIRAALESAAYQIYDAVKLMEEEAKVNLKAVNVDGGMTRNPFLMQFQADMLQIDVVRTEMVELSSLGAAFISGIGRGLWHSLSEITQLKNDKINVSPRMGIHLRDKYIKEWKTAVSRVM